jgi:polysaccharide deacetylase family protein (PEP-CTERM system associated)
MSALAPASRGGIVNALTIDVEDYFQVSAMEPHVDRSDWDGMPCRVERNIDRLLEVLADHDSRATFFTLGWVAERYPQTVRRIVAAGHELGSHGYGHERVSQMTRAQFFDDVHRAKSILEDLAGLAVIGYRAPSFSIGRDNQWAFDSLIEAGYLYSSSVYPIQHDHYGMPEAPRFAFRARGGLVEIPVTTMRLLGRNLPAGGGGYFRLAPYGLSRWAIRRVNEIEGQAAIFYFHPWEIDPEQPRINGVGWKTRFRHYLNLDRTETRLQRLLSDFRWDRVDSAFDLEAV